MAVGAVAGLDSENITSAVLCGVAFCAVLFIVKRVKSHSNYRFPKGPKALPFFGNALSLKDGDDLLHQLISFGKDYGPVYSLYLGRKLQIVVNGWEAIKEVTVKGGLDFGNRPLDIVEIDKNPNLLGIVEIPAGNEWKIQRKFAHTTLRGMGFGKVSLEPVIQEEVEHTMAYLLKTSGNPVNPRKAFSVGASNIISNLVFKRRIEHGSESGGELMTNVHDLMITESNALLTFFPFLWFILKRTGKFEKAAKAWGNVLNFLQEEIRVHQERIDAISGEPDIRDFIDAYLVHRKTDPGSYSLESLVYVLRDLFIAGTDTTSVTMTWAVLFLATNPETQQKIHDEIMQEVGNGQVSLSHRAGLPYTQAALLEVQRLGSIVSILPRVATKDVTLGGYRLPKGTEVLLNFWSLHNDLAVWPNPERFEPERFLDPDGSLKQLPENFLPFSAGKRNCMGEQLAKMELFLFFTSIVQQLKISLPQGHPVPSYEGVRDVVRTPQEFKVCISPW